jgi:hypothetical protein
MHRPRRWADGLHVVRTVSDGRVRGTLGGDPAPNRAYRPRRWLQDLTRDRSHGQSNTGIGGRVIAIHENDDRLDQFAEHHGSAPVEAIARSPAERAMQRGGRTGHP